MNEKLTGLESILGLLPEKNKYEQWGITFNPFPRSGTSNINGSDEVNRELCPLDNELYNGINQFIANALVPNKVEEDDQFISATIVGDYGSGKTQLLMYAKAKLNEIYNSQTYLKPYTIYIDNPGGSILEFMGTLIGKIGEENTRKYVWNHIIQVIQSSEEIQDKLKPYAPSTAVLFDEMKESINPYSDANTVSYKQFLDSFLRALPLAKKRSFDDLFSGIVQNILNEDTKDPTVAYYFYEFISSDFGINKTWEALTSGTLRQISGKEADVIRYIVKLLKREGYTHVFILVDEFEDLTAGRLSKVQLDNYIHNLRTLLDKHREWCLLFAMNPKALERLVLLSPPLADRITIRRLDINNLNKDEAHRVVESYLKLADFKQEFPFTEEALEYINATCDGNVRRVLKAVFVLFECAADAHVKVMDKEFVENNIPTF